MSEQTSDDIETLRELARKLQEDYPQNVMEGVNTESAMYTGCSGAYCMGMEFAGSELDDLLDELEQSTDRGTDQGDTYD